MANPQDWWIAISNNRDNTAFGSLTQASWLATCSGPFDNETEAWTEFRRLRNELHDILVKGGKSRHLWTTEEHQHLIGIDFWVVSSRDLASAPDRGVLVAEETTVREVFEETLGRRLPSWPPPDPPRWE